MDVTCVMLQDTLGNPTVMDFIDNSLTETSFTTQDILNFLYNGPDDKREAGKPNFDWRNIFNITDQMIRMFNKYGEVSSLSLIPVWQALAHSQD